MDRQILREGIYSNTEVQTDVIVYLFLLLTIVLVVFWLYYHQFMNNNFSILHSILLAISTIALSLFISIPYFYLGFITFGIILLIGTAIYFPRLLLKLKIENREFPFASTKQNLSNERNKILQMLEDGKINFQEAKELLNAIYEPVEKGTHKTKSHDFTSTYSAQMTGE